MSNNKTQAWNLLLGREHKCSLTMATVSLWWNCESEWFDKWDFSAQTLSATLTKNDCALRVF